MKTVNFNTVDLAVIGGKYVDRVYAGSTLVWKWNYLSGGVEAPTNVLALLSGGDVGINWDVPSTNQGVTISQYSVTYSRDGGNDIFLSYAPTNSLVYPFGGYPTGTYRFGVRALTNEGTGAAGYSNTVLVLPSPPPITDFTFSRVAGDNLSEFRWAGVSGNFPNVKIAPVSSAGGVPYDFVDIRMYDFSSGFFSMQMKFSNYGYAVGDTFNATVTNFTDSTQTEEVARSKFLCTIDPL